MHCVKFSRKVCANETQNISAPVIGKGTTVNYERAHGLFGHTGKDMSMQIANHLEIKTYEKEENPREDCIVGKAKQNEMTKASEHVKSAKIGERRFLDMSATKQNKGATKNAKRNWAIIVEECT